MALKSATTQVHGTSTEVPNHRPRCPLCGRAVHQRGAGKRGRPKVVHTNCGVILSRMAELQWRVKQVAWQSPHNIKKFRGDWMGLVSYWFNVKGELVFSDGDFETVADMESEPAK